MEATDLLAARFDGQRDRLRGLAYRIVGSSGDAEDAVQEAWIRLQRQTEPIDNLEGWLTTVVGRISLNQLRARRRAGSDGVDASPDLVVTSVEDIPEQQALLAGSVGVALMVVLDALSPPERVAFVLHDVFAVPFGEIAPMLGTTPTAARQLASRARRRVREAPRPDGDLAAQRRVVDAFFAAGRGGRLADLVAVLHPDVVLRADAGDGPRSTHGAAAVAKRARFFAGPERHVRPVVVNGAAGAVILVDGRPVAVMGFTVVAGHV
ncbi:MAG TPA: sigma-70 family RNA polymerase sigma factor, partial [Friedmanniella sp.]